MPEQPEQDQSALFKRIAAKSRRLGMLVEQNRAPDQATQIRAKFKRLEELSKQRAEVAERLRRKQK